MSFTFVTITNELFSQSARNYKYRSLIEKKFWRDTVLKNFSALSCGSRSLTNRLASKCLIMITEDDFWPMVAVAHTAWCGGKRTIGGVMYIGERAQCLSMRRRALTSISRSRERKIAIEKCSRVEDPLKHSSNEMTVDLSNPARCRRKPNGFRLYF